MKRLLPVTRADCADVPRPCAFRRCQHHIPDGAASCVLDVVDANPDGMTTEEVAAEFGCSRSYISLIEESALSKIRGKGVGKPNVVRPKTSEWSQDWANAETRVERIEVDADDERFCDMVWRAYKRKDVRQEYFGDEREAAE